MIQSEFSGGLLREATRRFELVDAKSPNRWEIIHEGRSYTLCFGKFEIMSRHLGEGY